jgi:branched-subunit amino acid ABC-type transport system permease component
MWQKCPISGRSLSIFPLEPFLRVFAAAVLGGGIMSIPGVVIGGELLGLIEIFLVTSGPSGKP